MRITANCNCPNKLSAKIPTKTEGDFFSGLPGKPAGDILPPEPLSKLEDGVTACQILNLNSGREIK